MSLLHNCFNLSLRFTNRSDKNYSNQLQKIIKTKLAKYSSNY